MRQLLALIAFVGLMAFFIAHGQAATPAKLIYDTDMSGDCDDAGALAMIHALADLGECELLAVVINDKNPAAVPAIDAVNHYYGRPDIPIGIRQDHGAKGENYPAKIAAEFPHDLTSAGDASDAVDLYRQILASQPDQSVTIVSVGFLTSLARLLDSPPDSHSPLDGEALVAAKIKELSCMGGQFDGVAQTEYNFRIDPTSTARVVADWPAPVMYSGFEIGDRIKTGAAFATVPASNPVRRAYEVYLGGLGKDRSSWDQTSVLYAVRGLGDYWEAVTTGYCTFNTGTRINGWAEDSDPSGRLAQGYLVAKMGNADIEKVIEGLMTPDAARPPTTSQYGWHSFIRR